MARQAEGTHQWTKVEVGVQKQRVNTKTVPYTTHTADNSYGIASLDHKVTLQNATSIEHIAREGEVVHLFVYNDAGGTGKEELQGVAVGWMGTKDEPPKLLAIDGKNIYNEKGEVQPGMSVIEPPPTAPSTPKEPGAPKAPKPLAASIYPKRVPLNPRETKALIGYVGLHFATMNSFLRVGEEAATAMGISDPNQIAAVKADITYLKSAIDKQKPTSAMLTVTREASRDAVSGLKAGDTFTDPGFTSTMLPGGELDEDAVDDPVHLTIDLPPGTSYLNVNQHIDYEKAAADGLELTPFENEALLMPNSSFRVDSVGDDEMHLTYILPSERTDYTVEAYDKKQGGAPTTLTKLFNQAVDAKIYAGSGYSAGSVKSNLARDIANRIDRKYDNELMGSFQMGSAVNPDAGKPYSELLTHDNVYLIRPYNDYGYPTYYGRTSDPKVANYLASLDGSKFAVRGDDPRVREGLREKGVSSLVQVWAGTSNDRSAISLALQDAATREFGLEETQGWDSTNYLALSGGPAKTLADDVTKMTEEKGPLFQAFLRAQYENTQRMFAEHGITRVPLYRGFQFNNSTAQAGSTPPPRPPWAIRGTVQDLTLRPLSSFSSTPGIARRFAGVQYNKNSVVIAGIVPVSQILSTSVTGLGCLNEKEVVVLGGTHKWTVTTMGDKKT